MANVAVDLKGKTVLITGASRGIGKAIATRLAEHGANLVLAARTQAPLDAAVKELKEKYKIDAIGVPCDVAKLENLKNLVAKAKEKFKQIDILVNVAGVSSQFLFH